MATIPSIEMSGFQPNPYYAQTQPYRSPNPQASSGGMPGAMSNIPWVPGMDVNMLNEYNQQAQIDRLPEKARIGSDPRMMDFVYGRGGFGGVLPNAEALFQQGGQKYYPGNAVAGFNPGEIEGQRQLKSYASQGLPGLVNLAQQGSRSLIGGGMGSNLQAPTSQTLQQLMSGRGAGSGMLRQAGSGSLSPHYQGVLQGGYNDAFRQYGNTVDSISQGFESGMHSADDAALLSGNFGGSRGEIARGIVGREATKQQGMAQQALGENMSQAYSGVMNQQFSDARNAQIQAGLGLSDSQLNAARVGAGIYGTDVSGRIAGVNAMTDVARLGTLPGEIYGAVGKQQRDMVQAQINADMQRFNFNQAQPWENMNRYADIVGGMGGLGGLGYENTPASGGAGGRWGSAIGGAVAGAGTGFMIGQGPGALVGGLAGGIGGYLGY